MRGILSICVLVCFSSVGCSQKTLYLDYASYPQLPMTTPIKIIRAITLKPQGESKSYWGNYGGPGNHGGKPVDAMDEVFRQHDIAYLEALKHRDALEADRLLIERLEVIEGLSEDGVAYRKLAVGFFSTSICRVVGKPLNLVFGTRKVPRIQDTGRGGK